MAAVEERRRKLRPRDGLSFFDVERGPYESDSRQREGGGEIPGRSLEMPILDWRGQSSENGGRMEKAPR